MKIKGIDRVVIAVKDWDQAAKFFSNLVGVEFEEIKGPAIEEGGVRFGVGLVPQTCDLRIELIQPIHPLKDARPPDPKAIAKSVENTDAALHALVFRVEDIDEASADVDSKGIRVYGRMEMPEVKAGPFAGVTDFKEIFTEGEDALGIPMAFVEYKDPSEE